MRQANHQSLSDHQKSRRILSWPLPAPSLIVSRRVALEMEALANQLENKRTGLIKLVDDATQLLNSLITLKKQVREFIRINRSRADGLGLDVEKVITFRLDDSSVSARRAELEQEIAEIDELLLGSAPESMPSRMRRLDDQILEVDAQLQGPTREYASQVAKLEEWTQTQRRLAVGTVNEPGVEILESRIARLDTLPDRLATLRNTRLDKVREIHTALRGIVDVYSHVYQPAASFIRTHPLATKARMEFGVGLQERDFESLFWRMYDRRIVGSFQGRESGAQLLDEYLSKTDFNDEEAVIEFLQKMDKAIHSNVRDRRQGYVDPFRAIRSDYTLNKLYDMVFGLDYVTAVYSLNYSGIPYRSAFSGRAWYAFADVLLAGGPQ